MLLLFWPEKSLHVPWLVFLKNIKGCSIHKNIQLVKNTQKHLSDGDIQYSVHIPFTYDPFHKLDSPTTWPSLRVLHTTSANSLGYKGTDLPFSRTGHQISHIN